MNNPYRGYLYFLVDMNKLKYDKTVANSLLIYVKYSLKCYAPILQLFYLYILYIPKNKYKHDFIGNQATIKPP